MLNILLAYVAYPVTTAAYWERALRTKANVKTIGPKLPERLLVDWNLGNMKVPILPHDITTQMDCDMKSMEQFIQEFRPDIYIWVESVPGYFPKNLQILRCPKACYLIDTYANFKWHIEWAKNFDYVFLADLSFVEKFRALGINAFWLPLGCDIEVHFSQPINPKYEIGFVGTVASGTERHRYLNMLANKFQVHYERSFLKEMTITFAQSKIVFNNAVGKTDLNMRFFEAMASGSLLLSDMAQHSGQDILFEPHQDYALYNDKNIVEVADYYLKNDWARQSVAKHGQELVMAGHTYDLRLEHFIDLIEGKLKRTFNPKEWRDFAQSRVEKKLIEKINLNQENIINRHSIRRSFIIPVLDYSPASQYNIKTLLQNLSNIGGEVIVVFNNQKVANEIKDNPRINHYAILKENIGVSRAWNLGLDICRTDIAFILNADLQITNSVIQKLQEVLDGIPEAAVVGPEGTYFNFDELRDYLYLDKGKFKSIVQVDAVAGFLFAVKTEYFKNKKLQFENDFTPCYFEEWDLGLQIKAAGLKAYAVPIDGYEHEWSGSIRSYKQIHYYDRLQTSKQIHMRNAYLFKKKWQQCEEWKKDPLFFQSNLFTILTKKFDAFIANRKLENAQFCLSQLEAFFPQHHELKKYYLQLESLKKS